MAQIKIINFELGRDDKTAEHGMYQLHVNYELIVTKAELIEAKLFALQFSIGASESSNHQFKLMGCEIKLPVSISDYSNDLQHTRIIDEFGRLHYLLQYTCKKISSNDIELFKIKNGIESVFVMADLYTSENHLLLGFTGSASKKVSEIKSVRF